MGGSKSVTIGYKYFMDIQMGLCRGPIDEIVEIEVGGFSAWKGSFTALAGSININRPDLFGGEKKEGGIDGTLQVFMGARNQVYPDAIKSMLGGIVPSFRNVCTTYFSGLVSAMTPYPKPWRYRLRRSARGWEGGVAWYPGTVTIVMQADDGSQVRAMNPIHMVYECLTNSAWGRGLSSTMIDDVAFRAAALAAYNEGFGLCALWSRQGNVDSFIQTVLDHLGAVFFVHPSTGLLTVKLIRNDYNPLTVPHFDYSEGLLAIEDLTTTSNHTATNSISATYTDPVTGETRTCPAVRNLAAIQAARSVNMQTVNYFAVPNAALAIRLATRDLQSRMGFLRKFTMHVDRRAWGLTPGSVITVTLPEHGIVRMPVRIGNISHSAMLEGRIAMEVIEDVFGLPATSFVSPQPPGWIPPDPTPYSPTLRLVREQGYRDVYRRLDPANFQLIEDVESFVSLLVGRPAGIPLSFEMWARTGAASYALRESASFCPTALVQQAVPLSAANVAVNLLSGIDLDMVRVGQVAAMGPEEFIVQAINATAGTVTLARGTLDSVPVAHPANSRIWFYDEDAADDTTSYLVGATVQTRALTRTSQGLLALNSAPDNNIVTVGRFGRPYPPGNLRVNSVALGSIMPFSRPAVFTWSHRNREVQQDQLYAHSATSLAKPSGVSYTVRILRPDGTVLRTVADLEGTTWTYTEEMITADDIDTAGGGFRFQLWSMENGLASYRVYDIPLVIIQPGLGNSLGYYLGGE